LTELNRALFDRIDKLWKEAQRLLKPSGNSQEYPAPSCKDIKLNNKFARNDTYWIDPNGGSPSDAVRAECIFHDDGSVETCLSTGVASENLATYKQPRSSDPDYWQSHLLVENAVSPPDLHDQSPHTQMNLLRSQHRFATQELEFFCEGTTIFGGDMNWETGVVDTSKATSLLAHNGRVIDLTKGIRHGPSANYVEKIDFESPIRKHDVSIAVEYDGCRHRQPGTSTKMRIETRDTQLLPIIDFTVKDFDHTGRSTLSLAVKAVCFKN
uniref:Fibrillar collagen NC1 domain-containing protein n=1 Tax=Hydatigena taeniaeformis TaxID=6205 RepID=A0A0R3WUC3_HYDTA